MSSPVDAVAGRREWWATPRIVLPIFGVLVLLVALLTPESEAGRMGDDRLSAQLAGSQGARVLAELAGRFGWNVLRNEEPELPARPAGTVIHAVLAPAMPLTAAEAHAYLEAVRAGDALLMVAEPHSALSDSLGIRPTRGGGTFEPVARDIESCTRREFAPALWPDGQVHVYGLSFHRTIPDTLIFASVQMGPEREQMPTLAAAVGFPYGRGRIAVVSDPDLLRNDVLRHCHWGLDVVSLQMLEWLRAGGAQPRGTLAFDEYHQGFGSHSSSMRAIRRFLYGHPVGRTILIVLAASLILLLALAPRPLPPRPRDRVERRDPLEQVEALALAYEQVGATRTATARLVRGLRSRVERSVALGRARSDDDFLTDALASAPHLAADVALVRAALREGRPNDTLPEIGEALRRIEDSLMTTPVA